MRKILLNSVLILGIIYGILYSMIIGWNIFYAIKWPEELKQLYGMDATGLHWQFPSFPNYFTFQTAILSVYVFYIVFNFLAYNKRKTALFRLVLMADVIILILMIRFNMLHQESGYDHYPGFDPYFF